MSKNKSVNLNALLDSKLPNIINVIKTASDDMVAASEGIANSIQKIQQSYSDINREMQETISQETETDEAAQAKAQADIGTNIVPELRRISARIDRLAKNNKAITGLLSAASALHKEPDEDSE